MIDTGKIHQLLAQVQLPPGDLLPTGLTDDECDAFEQRTQIRLSEDLRDWLKLTNGPCVGPGGLYGIRAKRDHLNIESYFEMFPPWKDNKWIPIAGDGCGNYYLIPTLADFGPGFPVLFFDTSHSIDTPSFVAASDIGHFLIALLEKEFGARGWPFRQAYVTQSDPQIVNFPTAGMPWASD